MNREILSTYFQRKEERQKANSSFLKYDHNQKTTNSLPMPFIQDRKRGIRNRTEVSQSEKDDSLQVFQEQLESAIKRKKTERMSHQNLIERKKGQNAMIRETQNLKKEMRDIKGILKKDTGFKKIESKFDNLIHYFEQKREQQRLTKKEENRSQLSIPQKPSNQTHNFAQPHPINYIPQPLFVPYPYLPQIHPYSRKHSDFSDREERTKSDFYSSRRKTPYSHQKYRNPEINSYKKKNLARRRLKKVFLAVAYVIFLKKEVQRLSQLRKQNLKTFAKEKFQIQMNSIKNWLLEAFQYSLSLILQKNALKFAYFSDKSEKVRVEKQKFIFKVIEIGISKLLDITTPLKVLNFSQLLYQLCFRGSFILPNFWTAHEMDQICISQSFGYIRADSSMEKFLLGVMIFIKIFTFNMLLQPHKFDVKNFPRNSPQVKANMKVIASVFYHMIKEIVESHRIQPRDKRIFEQGNWMRVSKKFIEQCSEPLITGEFEAEEEYISGLHSRKEIYSMTGHPEWQECKLTMGKIIDKLHLELQNRMKLVRKNLRYQLN